jgi:hypothetical protein
MAHIEAYMDTDYCQLHGVLQDPPPRTPRTQGATDAQHLLLGPLGPQARSRAARPDRQAVPAVHLQRLRPLRLPDREAAHQSQVPQQRCARLHDPPR